MSSIFSLRRSNEEDDRTAGGKIVRGRRSRASERTPYARPIPLQSQPEETESSGNPNWISAIASGAGKIFSSVFGPDYSSSWSSGGDSSSEDEDDASNASDVDRNKVLSSMNTKSENMQMIQQLIMQQTFSREECDELEKLIRSRVVTGDENLRNTDACNSAVLEARKWLEERKYRSGSKLMVEDQTLANHGALSLATHGEIGSPVDMAKSFMQAQPTWSSSALKRVEFNTPSPMKNAKEIFHSPVQLSEMEGSAHSTGSWNLLDEIRRVRSKATEDLLAPTPSKKISFPSDSPADKSMLDTTTKNVSNERIGDELSSDPNTSLAENGSKLPESVEMDCEKSEGGALQSNKGIGNSDAVNCTDPDANSKQHDGSRLSNEMNGLKDSSTNDHAISLSAADKETTDFAVDSSKEKADFNGSQDSSSMAYEDSLQDENSTYPKNKGKDATKPARKLRPRNKSGKS